MSETNKTEACEICGFICPGDTSERKHSCVDLLKMSVYHLNEELEYLKSPEGRSAEKVCACLKCITVVAKVEAQLVTITEERNRLLASLKEVMEYPDCLTIEHKSSELDRAIKAIQEVEK